MGYEPTWQLGTTNSEYADLVDALNALGEYEMRNYRDKFDTMGPDDVTIHRGRVDSWHDGPLVKLQPEKAGEETTPSLDRTPMQAVLSEGFVGHGSYPSTRGNDETTWNWYLVPLEDLDELVESAEEYMKQRTSFAVVTEEDGEPLRIGLTEGAIASFDTIGEAEAAANVLPGDWEAVRMAEVQS